MQFDVFKLKIMHERQFKYRFISEFLNQLLYCYISIRDTSLNHIFNFMKFTKLFWNNNNNNNKRILSQFVNNFRN